MTHMRTVIPVLSILSLVACTHTPPTRSVHAHIGGGNGRMLYFDKFQGNKPVHTDSVRLDAQGNADLELAYMPLDFYALTLGDKDMLVLVLDSAESVAVDATAGALQEPTKVEGSANSDLLYGYFSDAKKFDAEKKELIDRINANRSDSVALARINAVNSEFYDHSKKFVEDHKGSPAVLAAMSRLNIQQELPLFIQVRESLRKTIPTSEYFAGFRDQVDRLEQQASAAKAQEEQMARMDNLIPVGSAAPQFTQATPDGKQLSLSDFKGKVVLIDFWASWCKPCRMEMPNVKAVYAKYHGKGFEILGVSLDAKKEAWLGAIQQDGLPWKHVSDLGSWNNAVAQQYGVTSIPYTVLVDRDGNVLAKQLRGPALDQKLAEVFK